MSERKYIVASICSFVLFLASCDSVESGESPIGGELPAVRVITPIADTLVFLNDPPLIYPLVSRFSRSEGVGGVLYSANSSDPATASVDVVAGILTVSAARAGEVEITVEAVGELGGRALLSFKLSILEVPVIRVTAPLPDTLMYRDRSPLGLALASVFSGDAGSGSLRYSADTSDPAVATVEVEADTVRITPVQLGNATVTVHARGERGGPVSTSFRLSVLQPVCTFDPPSGALDRFPLEPGLVWEFNAEERIAVRDDITRYRGIWTVQFDEEGCDGDVRIANLIASFEGEKGQINTLTGLVRWVAFSSSRSLSYRETEGQAVMVVPSLVVGTTASFSRYGPEEDIVATPMLPPNCTGFSDEIVFSAGVGLTSRTLNCGGLFGYRVSSSLQRR